MLWPEQLRGLSFTADLFGDPSRLEMPKAFEGSAVASLRKREEKVWLTTFVPIEFIPSLSAAYHDDRLQFVIASGPKLKRNESLLNYLSFQESNYTEQHWGMPWVTANDLKTEPDGAGAATKLG